MDKQTIWEDIIKDRGRVHGKSMLEMFLTLTNNLEAHHYDELSEENKKLVNPEVRLMNAKSGEDIKTATRAGAKDFDRAIRNFVMRASVTPKTLDVEAAKKTFEWILQNPESSLGKTDLHADPAWLGLVYAASYWNTELMDLAITAGAKDLNGAMGWAMIRHEYRSSHDVSWPSRRKAVEFLLEKGADTGKALLSAVSNSNIQASTMLAEKASQTSLHAAFILAAEDLHRDILLMLHAKGAGKTKSVVARAFVLAKEQDKDIAGEANEKEDILAFLKKRLEEFDKSESSAINKVQGS